MTDNRMTRLEFIFRAVNALAGKRDEPVTEYLLTEAIRREIEIAKQELRVNSAFSGGIRRTSAEKLHDHNAGCSQF